MTTAQGAAVARAPGLTTPNPASGTLPLMCVQAASNRAFEIAFINITQETTINSANGAFEIVRCNALPAGTLTAPGAVVAPMHPSAATPGVAVWTAGFTGVGSGTPVVLERRGFNVVAPVQYFPVPEVRYVIGAGQTLWVRLPVYPASVTVNIEVGLIEL